MLRISDASGAVVRELNIPDSKNAAGIQTVCWDQRVEPVRPIAGAGPGGGGGFGGGQGNQARRPIPGYPVPLPPVGYEAANPCAGAGPGGGGGFGGNQNNGPLVLPGTYSVALLVDGKEVERKSLEIVMDPQVQLTGAARVAYNSAAMTLHTAHANGAAAAAPLAALQQQMRTVSAQVDSSSRLSAEVKAEFKAFQREFDALRAKFGVGAPAGGPGGGGGFAAAAAAANQANVLGRVAQTKNNLLAVWEAPSDALTQQAAAAQRDLAAAVAEAQAFMPKAREMSSKLAAGGVTMTVGN
jgi:hypothetical protein